MLNKLLPLPRSSNHRRRTVELTAQGKHCGLTTTYEAALNIRRRGGGGGILQQIKSRGVYLQANPLHRRLFRLTEVQEGWSDI